MNVLIKTWANKNFGDDLFLKAVLERYYSNKNHYYILVYNREDYSFLTQNSNNSGGGYKNIQLIEYPSIGLIKRAICKLSMNGYQLRMNYYKRAFDSCFGNLNIDVFLNIGGSLFAEYENKLNISNYLEELYASLPIKHKFLLNINFGPYKTDSFVEWATNIFKKYDSVCFRDYASFALFKDKINCHLGFDIGLCALESEIKVQSINKCVGINLIDLSENRRTAELRDEYIPIYDNLVFNLTKKIMKCGYSIKLISLYDNKKESDYFQKFEMKVKNELSCSSQDISFIQYSPMNMNDFIDEIKKCDYMIDTRFHSLVLSIALNKQFYAICYDDKIENALRTINYAGEYSTLFHLDSANHIINALKRNPIVNNDELRLLSEKSFIDSDRVLMEEK